MLLRFYRMNVPVIAIWLLIQKTLIGSWFWESPNSDIFGNLSEFLFHFSFDADNNGFFLVYTKPRISLIWGDGKHCSAAPPCSSHVSDILYFLPNTPFVHLFLSSIRGDLCLLIRVLSVGNPSLQMVWVLVLPLQWKWMTLFFFSAKGHLAAETVFFLQQALQLSFPVLSVVPTPGNFSEICNWYQINLANLNLCM